LKQTLPLKTQGPFILTSLHPRPEAEKRQKEALTSWVQAGFRPVSLNFSEEMDEVRACYNELAEIVESKQPCSGAKKRKLVAVTDLIEVSYGKNRGAFSLVLNADIILDPSARDCLVDQAGGVTMIPRWLVDVSHQGKRAEKDPWGYDGVRLGPELRGVFTNRAFGLGLPWWDYWIPFRALHLGHSVRILNEPLAFHVRHEERWDEQDRARLAGEVWREVGVPPWKRLWRKHLGPRHERKNYGYHNHLAGFVRSEVEQSISKERTSPFLIQ